MTSTPYNFQVGATANDQLNASKLEREILVSPLITIAVDLEAGGIVASGVDPTDLITIWMKDTLSPAEVTALGGVVAAHDGQPLTFIPSNASGNPIMAVDTVKEQDGRQVVVTSPGNQGWSAFFAGADDDPAPTPPATGRGTGTQILLSWVAVSTKTQDLRFIEPVEVQNAQFYFDPAQWNAGDLLSMGIKMAATVATPNGGGTGNCNLVSVGAYNKIVPAAGTGTHDVNLADAVPVAANQSGGEWDVDYELGTIAAASPGEGAFNLFDQAFTFYFVRNAPLGSPQGIFELVTYKPKWVHPNQRWLVEVARTTNGPGTFSGLLLLFRKYTE